MSFKYSKGAQVIGDLKAQDDTQRDTQIDFGEDYIGFETSGSLRMKISGSDGSITFNEAFTFPISDGSANQVLKTNGSGQLSWTNQSGGGSSGVTIPYPRLYFSGISPVSQIGNNSFTNATISTDNGKYENGFIDFGSSGNTAPARFENEIPLLGGVYTFSFWFYSKRTGSDWGSILRRESGGNPSTTTDYPIITEDSTDELGVGIEPGSNPMQFYSSGYDMTQHEGSTSWIHMAVVANGTNSRFYINGSHVGTADAVVTTSAKELGSYDGNDTQTFGEGIDDFAHWAEALSDAQISAIYNSSSKLRDIVT